MPLSYNVQRTAALACPRVAASLFARRKPFSTPSPPPSFRTYAQHDVDVLSRNLVDGKALALHRADQ